MEVLKNSGGPYFSKVGWLRLGSNDEKDFCSSGQEMNVQFVVLGGPLAIDATLLQNARERFQCFKWRPRAKNIGPNLTDTSSTQLKSLKMQLNMAAL